MISPSGEYAESRPFKIFISLLDKWEIGAPLTEVLVYDALKAAKHLMERPVNSSEDVSATLNENPFVLKLTWWARFQRQQAPSMRQKSHSSHGSIC
jgi:hypothetical protein